MVNEKKGLSDLSMLKKLYQLKRQGENLNFMRNPETGRTYLQEAACNGFLSSLLFLIRNEVDVNYSPYDDSALMMATRKEQLAAMEMLLQHKADMNAISYGSSSDMLETPWNYARANHMVKEVELFIKYGAPCTPAELEVIKRQAQQDGVVRMKQSDLVPER